VRVKKVEKFVGENKSLPFNVYEEEKDSTRSLSKSETLLLLVSLSSLLLFDVDEGCCPID
jgi:hypothetical protein